MLESSPAMNRMRSHFIQQYRDLLNLWVAFPHQTIDFIRFRT